VDKRIYTRRGPNIPDRVRKLICKIYVENEDQTAKEVMTKLHIILKKEMGAQWPQGWPGISAIQKELEKFHKRRPALEDEDKLWSQVALAAFPLPLEAIPIVYRVWASCLLQGKPLTIRQAKWVANLSHIYIKKDEFGNIDEQTIKALRTSAWAAAVHEKVLKLTEGLSDRYNDMLWFWLEDAHHYYELTGDGHLLALLNEQCNQNVKNEPEAQSVAEDAGEVQWSPETSRRKTKKLGGD